MSTTKRINNSKGHWYKLDGEKATGVTKVIGDGIPKPALVPWAAREVATFAADNVETLASLEHDERIDLLKGAQYRNRDRAARRGTEVHRLAEQLVSDIEVQVPEELAGHVDSYIRFLDEWNPQPVLVEGVVGHRTHGWMGTFDLLADIGDERWLLDLKTTRSGIFPETAVQLAAYRHAEFYLDASGNEQPMLPVDQVGAIWVRADGYDFIPVNAGPDTYKVFRYAQQIARFQNTDNSEFVGDALTPPNQESAA